MSGKTKGTICGIGMAAGAGLLIFGLTRDGESGQYTIPIIGVLLFIGSVALLNSWTK